VKEVNALPFSFRVRPIIRTVPNRNTCGKALFPDGFCLCSIQIEYLGLVKEVIIGVYQSGKDIASPAPIIARIEEFLVYAAPKEVIFAISCGKSNQFDHRL
jgi:hypothetical protein